MATVSDEVLVRVIADVADLKRQLASASNNINTFGKKAETSMGSLVAASRLAGAAIGTVIGSALIGGTVRVISNFERLEAQLLTVTGSADKARVAFNSLQDFAMKTPFQLEEVVGAFAKLKALGLDPSIDALTSYGNTAAAMGKSLNQVMEAVADAATGEFERLKEFGIRARTETDGIVFTFQGASTKVGKNAKEIESYLQSIGKTKFGDGMKNQSDTLGVSLSNLKDSWDKFIKALGDAGATHTIKGVVNGLQSIINKSTEAIGSFQNWSKQSALDSTNSALAKINTQIHEIEEKGNAAVPWYDRLFGVDAQQKLDGLNKRMAMMMETKAALESGLAVPKASEDPTAKQESTGGGGASWGGTDPVADAAKKAEDERERIREQISARLEAVQEGLMSEAELRAKQFAEDQLTLEQALEQRLITEEEYLATSAALEAQYNKEKADERAKLEADTNQIITNMRKQLNSDIIGLLNQLGSKNKAIKIAALAFEKVVAIQEAIMATEVAAAKALAWGGPPAHALVKGLGYASVAAIAATGLSQASDMLSSDSGSSSGGRSSASVSGGGNPLDGTSAAGVSSSVSREAAIVLQGNSFSAEQVDELIDKISERMGDGARFTTIRVSK